MAKGGCARVAFPIVKGKEKGGCGRTACSLVATPLLGGVEATQGLHAAHLSLAKREDEETRVCLERALF
jgi:hypothetical protein